MRSINEVRPKSGWLVAVAILMMADTAMGQDWSRQFVSAARFKLLEDFDYEAALDRETRLVWEIQPLGSTTGWQGARNHCLGKEVGGRLGWRLPTIEELASLVDPDELAPALPAGHPFLGVLDGLYWSATNFSGNPFFARVVNFELGGTSSWSKVDTAWVRCVRGGSAYDG